MAIKLLEKCRLAFETTPMMDQGICMWMDAQIQREGGYNPKRIAEFAEGYCSWGMFQNHVCVHQNWSKSDARYIYTVLTQPDRFTQQERDRLAKFQFLLDGDWQIDEMIRRYQARMTENRYMKLCRDRDTGVINGHRLSPEIYCAIRHHNWGGGRNYVSAVISKKIDLYGSQ